MFDDDYEYEEEYEIRDDDDIDDDEDCLLYTSIGALPVIVSFHLRS